MPHTDRYNNEHTTNEHIMQQMYKSNTKDPSTISPKNQTNNNNLPYNRNHNQQTRRTRKPEPQTAIENT